MRHYPNPKLPPEIKRQIDALRSQIKELSHGHIKMDALGIDYQIPEEVTSLHRWKNRIYIWLGASLIGVVAVLFARGCDTAADFFLQNYKQYPWMPFIVTPFGFLAVRFCVSNFFAGSEGSGIPQVIAGLHPLEQGKDSPFLRFPAIVGKVIGGIGALLFGASLGREGPSVQIGAIILKYFGRFGGTQIQYSRRSLLLAGGAAGMSAAFNTPIAGIVFAIEELSKSFFARETSILLMAIVVSGLTALSLSGTYFYFGQSSAVLVGTETMYGVFIGIIGGICGGLFSIILVAGGIRINKLSIKRKYLMTFIFGLVVATVGYLTDGVTFGTGYEQARILLNGESTASQFALSKMIATLFSYWAGIPGGLFSPSLAVGAGIGAMVAELVNSSHAQAFALLGMVSYFAGIIRSPITAVIIVSEMTDSHKMLFPLLLASITAYGVSKALSRDSLYDVLADQFLARQKKAMQKSDAVSASKSDDGNS